MGQSGHFDYLGIGFFGYTPAEGQAILDSGEGTDAERFACVHRGALLRVAKCDLCGAKDQPFDVFACAVHSECSIGRRKRSVKSCVACEQRTTSPTAVVSE